MKIAKKFAVTSQTKKTDGKELGTFAELLEDTDCPAFSTSNLEKDPLFVSKEEAKSVAVFVFDETADDSTPPEMFICSKNLSRVVRRALNLKYDRNDVMATLLSLQVFENDKGRFIAVNSVKRDRFNKKQLMEKIKTFSYEELAQVGK